MMNIIQAVEDRLNYVNLTEQEKMNYIKNKLGLTHGNGKKKKKKKGRKK